MPPAIRRAPLQTAQALLARTPPVDAAKQRIAWTIIGQVSFNQGDFAAGRERLHAMRWRVAAANDPERADITERLAAAVYKQGEAKRRAGDQAGAAEDFLRVARVAPGSKVVATSQYDAAAALITAQQWDRGDRGAREPTAATIPRANTAPMSVASSRWPTSRPAARRQAAAGIRAHRRQSAARTGRGARGDRQGRRPVCSNPATTRTQRGDARAAGEGISDAGARCDRGAAAAAGYRAKSRRCSSASATGSARSCKADATAGGGAHRSHQVLWPRTPQLALAQPARDAVSRHQAGRAAQAEPGRQEARHWRRRCRPTRSVADYQVAETTTAATYETAELYRTLAHDLLASERPKKLSAEELRAVRLTARGAGLSVRGAGDRDSRAQRQACRDGVYDDSVRKSLQALAELKPARYGKTEEATGLIVVLLPPNPPAPSTPTASTPTVSAPTPLAPATPGGTPKHRDAASGSRRADDHARAGGAAECRGQQ